MRFIAVNCSRSSGEETFCAFCTTPIGKSYVRDLQTRLVYHSPYCLEAHAEQSIVCIEDAGRRIS